MISEQKIFKRKAQRNVNAHVLIGGETRMEWKMIKIFDFDLRLRESNGK